MNKFLQHIFLTAALILSLFAGAFGQEYVEEPESQPEAPVRWIKCADEGALCSFAGTRRVRYGAVDEFREGVFTDTVACTNDVFGDPFYGVFKICETTGDLPDYSNVPPSPVVPQVPKLYVRLEPLLDTSAGVFVGDSIPFAARLSATEGNALPAEVPLIGFYVLHEDGSTNLTIEADGRGVVRVVAPGRAAVVARVTTGDSAGATSDPFTFDVPPIVVRIDGSGKWMRVGQAARRYRQDITGTRAAVWSTTPSTVATLRTTAKGDALLTPRAPGRAVLRLCAGDVCDDIPIKVY